jgi:hypothetical protein
MKILDLLNSIQNPLGSLPTTLFRIPSSLMFPGMTEATTQVRMTDNREENGKTETTDMEEISKVKMATREKNSKVKKATKEGNSSKIKTTRSMSVRITKVTIPKQGLSLAKLKMGTIEVDKMVHKEITTEVQAEDQAVVMHLDLRLQVRMALFYKCLDGDIRKWKALSFISLPII